MTDRNDDSTQDLNASPVQSPTVDNGDAENQTPVS